MATAEARKPSRAKIDLTGQRFGRVVAIRYVGNRMWLCRCDCGTERAIPGHYLRRGASRSCGCLRADLGRVRNRTHGRRRSAEWGAWESMRQRCLNPKHKAYPNYGGRGITICPDWLASFEAFLRDMGDRPGPSYSLDRIDSNGNYEPGNCRWATRIQQEHNKRSNRLLNVNGRELPLAVAARMHGLSPGTLADRLSYGWTLERALTEPVRQRRKRDGE